MAALLLTLALAGAVLAQVALPVDWWVFGGGGGPAAGGDITLDGTLGQPIAGASTSGDVALNAGYWQEDRRAASTTALSSSANPSLAGGPLTLTATVSGSSGTPTGTVTFKEGAATLATVPLAAGVASYDAAALPAGTHHITAVYGGDMSFLGSSSALAQEVRLRATTTSIGATDVAYHGDGTVLVTVSSPSGTPTGSVSLSVDGGAAQVKALDGVGKASFIVAGPAAGDHTLDASYAAQGNYAASSATGTLHVEQSATTTTVGPSSSPTVWGQTVTFTAQVAAVAPGSGTPAGSVTFKDGSTTLGSRPLDGSGQAALSTASLAVGAHTISAVYTGDGNYTGSNGSCSQTVNQAATTTSASGSPDPSVYGQSVTLAATVTVDAPGGGTPTGTVTFKEGSTSLGSGPLDGSGVAALATSSLTVGSHSITAAYTGDGNVQASNATCDLAVAKASTTTTVGAGPASPVYGQAVTFTATVAAVAPGGGTPTGTVAFKDGGTSIGSATLHASGVATLSISTLAVGSHTITAIYGGDAGFLTSSGALAAPYAVAKAATTMAIAAVTPGPASLVGQTVTVRFGVTVSLPGAGTPTGTVTVSDGTDSCSATPAADGTASCSLALTTPGDRTLAAAYAGDTSFLPSSSAGVAQHVNRPPLAKAGGPYSGDEGAAIAFDGSASSDPDPGETATLRYEWTFGDATTGTGQKPAHTYAHSGSYTVTLLVTDAYGASASDTAVVTVRNVAPSLSGQFDQAADEGTLTSFNLGSFADPGSGPWTVRVSWGDGTTSTFTATSAGALGYQAHAYDDNGSYTVSITVTDDNSASATATCQASIRNVAPTVRIDSSVSAGGQGTAVGLWAHPTDPSGADTRAGFDYQWSLKRDGVEIGTGSADSLGFTIPPGDTAIYLAEVQVKDKDGGTGGMSWHTRGLVSAQGVLQAALDARIQILWPHGGVGVSEATLANLSAWLLQPGTLHPAALSGDAIVYLWRSLNNGPAAIVATGVRRGGSSLFDFNNVDVSAARDAKNKLFFWVSVAGIPTHSNVWIHAQDGRTYAPAQDAPKAAGYSGSPVDARIEILWPHGNASVRNAGLANLTAMLFRPGTLESASPNWSPTVRLWRALDNGVLQAVAVGEKRLVTKNGVTYPVWDFNNVDVSAAKDAAHKLIFVLTVDGVEAHSNVWVHGVDARTIFPLWDVME